MGFIRVSYRTLVLAFILFSLLSIALCARQVRAQTAKQGEQVPSGWIGLSAFGIQSPNFQGAICNNFLKAVAQSPKPAIAILFHTFGADNRCLKKFWSQSKKSGKPYLTEIHFSNEAGRRAGTMDKMDFLWDRDVNSYNKLLEKMPAWLERDIRNRVSQIVALTARHAGTGHFILSAGLEDNYTPAAWENLYRILKEEWPSVIARNPVLNRAMRKQGWTAPAGLYVEHHGYKTRNFTENLCIVNGDGQDVSFLSGSGLDFRHSRAATMKEVRKWIERARESNCIIFLWAGKWQGYFRSGDTPPRPLSRKFRFDSGDIEGVRPFLETGQQSGIRKKRRK